MKHDNPEEAGTDKAGCKRRVSGPLGDVIEICKAHSDDLRSFSDWPGRADSSRAQRVLRRDDRDAAGLVSPCKTRNAAAPTFAPCTHASVVNACAYHTRMQRNEHRAVFWQHLGMVRTEGCEKTGEFLVGAY
eukprot:1731335-Prymnesium_polylepis.2